jgi:hypothetical protein
MIARYLEQPERRRSGIAGPVGLCLTVRGKRLVRIFSFLARHVAPSASGEAREGDDAS